MLLGSERQTVRKTDNRGNTEISSSEGIFNERQIVPTGHLRDYHFRLFGSNHRSCPFLTVFRSQKEKAPYEVGLAPDHYTGKNYTARYQAGVRLKLEHGGHRAYVADSVYPSVLSSLQTKRRTQPDPLPLAPRAYPAPFSFDTREDHHCASSYWLT